jgi:hypothetical protein
MRMMSRGTYDFAVSSRLVELRQRTSLTTVVIDRHGYRFDWRAPRAIARRAAERGVENRICRLAMQELAPGATGIDVGTNFGFISCVMASTGANVVGFEADPWIARECRKNLARNGWQDQAEIHAKPAGLAPALTIDSLAGDLHDVRFLKIDVDGPDFDVLLGAEKVIEVHRPVIVIEMNGPDTGAIHDWLSSRYGHLMGMSNEPVDRGNPPPNLIASSSPISIPGV